MIFCSRRVYLNILTQLMDLDTLLNANYFLIDQVKPTGYANIDDGQMDREFGQSQPALNQFGEITPGLIFPKKTNMHGYFIHYTNVFDCTPFLASASASAKNDYSSPMEKFMSHMMTSEFHQRVYETIFNVDLQGNNLQILLMRSDYNCQMFGHVICQFLSQVFGADITFVDPKYRPRTHGQLQYIGNKDYARQHIQELRDMALKTRIQTAVDTAQYGDGMNNLMQLLNNGDMTIEKLFYVYNLIFPNAPLPAGNYTKDHLIRIICGRILDSTGHTGETISSDILKNGNFFSFVNAYDSGIDEEELRKMAEEDFSDVQ